MFISCLHGNSSFFSISLWLHSSISLLSFMVLYYTPKGLTSTLVDLSSAKLFSAISSSCANANVDALPMDTNFSLPAPLPPWPPGSGFATGRIDLGGLVVSEMETTSLRKIWATYEGGPDNKGATFLEPAPSVIPQGFFMLGCCSQPNNRPLSVTLLCARDDTPDGALLNKPLDYALVWRSDSDSTVKQDGTGFVWLPLPPDGYRALGHVVTSSPEKPSLEKVRCVRSDFTDESQARSWIWGNLKDDGISVSVVVPRNRGSKFMAMPVGTFISQTAQTASLPLPCLKNVNSNLLSMPNLPQIQSLFQTYGPRVYFHPDEHYLPSSVSWFFQNGALLYKKGEESSPVPVDPTGSNLPQGGSNDGAYWLDLPKDEKAKKRVKKGDLSQFQAYLHVKPMLGATCTDIGVWIFYPFNGPARAKVELFNVPLGRIGQHVGDWEHLTLRISNFNGQLLRMYFSQHSGGSWVEASDLEFAAGGSNKPVAYSSLNGHAMYPKPGLVLQGSGGIGIRNDTGKSKSLVDTETGFSVVAAEYLGNAVVEPPWLEYAREWGPKISYNVAEEIRKVDKVLPGKLKSAFEKVINGLPDEVLGEEGPTGPKMKASWDGDEKD